MQDPGSRSIEVGLPRASLGSGATSIELDSGRSGLITPLGMRNLSISLVRRWVETGWNGDPVLFADIPLSQLPAAYFVRTLWSLTWAGAGFPRIVWNQEAYPEMLMATTADASVLTHVVPPWNAFLVDLPKGLILSRSLDGQRTVAMQNLLVLRAYGNGPHDAPDTPPRWVWFLLAQGADTAKDSRVIELWRSGVTSEELLHEEDWLERYPGDDRDKRSLVLLGRLVLGLCLSLSDPTKVHEAKFVERGGVSGKVRSRPKRAPSVTTNYVVGAPCRVRVREELVRYLDQGPTRSGTSPSVRSLVRGHWKMQPHGPNRSLRKLIHREPYWSPRDPSLPILVRETLIDSSPPRDSVP